MPKIHLFKFDEQDIIGEVCQDVVDQSPDVYTQVEIPEDKLKWARRVMDEFDAVQDYLGLLMSGELVTE